MAEETPLRAVATDGQAAAAPAAPAFDPSSLLPIVLMMGWSKLGIDASEGTDALMWCRAAFVTAIAVCVVAIVVIQLKAGKNPEPGTVVVTAKGADGVETTTSQTVSEYDVAQVRSLLTSILLPAALITFLHVKYAFIRPLPLQAIMMPLTLYKSKLAQIYLRGYKATGELKRPWSPPSNALADMLSGGAKDEVAPAADAVAEKKGN